MPEQNEKQTKKQGSLAQKGIKNNEGEKPTQKKKKYKFEDDPSDKIEETLTERAVIHKAVEKIDKTDGEDLIDSFINESEPAQQTNSWLSTSVEGDKKEPVLTSSVMTAAPTTTPSAAPSSSSSTTL